MTQVKISNVEESPKKFNIFIKENADDLSVIGLKHCYDKQRPVYMRLMWVILIIVGVASAIDLIYDRAHEYFSYPVRTNLEMIAANSLDYPKITICNVNQIKKSAASEQGNSLTYKY